MLTFLAGVWLVAAPPALHFEAAQHAFRPYWVPLVLAVVIMLAGLIRAVAPLDVPWLRAATIVLASSLVVTAFLFRDDADAAVQINQMAVGAGIVLASLAVVIVNGEWLG